MAKRGAKMKEINGQNHDHPTKIPKNFSKKYLARKEDTSKQNANRCT